MKMYRVVPQTNERISSVGLCITSEVHVLFN